MFQVFSCGYSPENKHDSGTSTIFEEYFPIEQWWFSNVMFVFMSVKHWPNIPWLRIRSLVDSVKLGEERPCEAW